MSAKLNNHQRFKRMDNSLSTRWHSTAGTTNSQEMRTTHLTTSNASPKIQENPFSYSRQPITWMFRTQLGKRFGRLISSQTNKNNNKILSRSLRPKSPHPNGSNMMIWMILKKWANLRWFPCKCLSSQNTKRKLKLSRMSYQSQRQPLIPK